MHKSESVLENESHKIPSIQIDYLILARRPDIGLINKKKRTCYLVDFAVPIGYRMKMKESE